MRIIYWLIFIELSVAGTLEFNKCRYKSIISALFIFNIIIFILFATFKDSELVADAPTYINALNGKEIILEPTFNLFAGFINDFLNGNPIWLFFIYSLISIITKGLSISELSPFVLLSLLIWFSDFYPLHELAQIRVAAAGGIFLLSLKSLYQHNFKHYLLWCILACLFHFSAILMLFLWPLSRNKINKVFWLTISLSSFIIAFIGIDIAYCMTYLPIEGITQKYEAYQAIQQGMNETKLFSPLIIGKYLILLLMLWKSNLLYDKNRYVYLFLKIMFISVIARSLLASNLAIAQRISEFFSVVEILLFPLVMYLFSSKKLAYSFLLFIAVGLASVRIFSNNLIMTST